MNREQARALGRQQAAAAGRGVRIPLGISPATADYFAATTAAAPSGGPEPMPGEHLRAVMHVRGESTGGDGTGRTFVNTEYREPPFAFNYQLRSSAHGGLPEVAHVGNVVRVVEDGAALWAFITLDLDGAEGQNYARRAVGGFERWVSIGLDERKPRTVLSWPEHGEEPDPDDPNPDTELFEPEHVLIDGGRIAELTGVSVPAQADAIIEPTAELLALYGQPAEPGEVPEEPALAASAAGHDCGCGGACGCGPPSTADQVQAITAASMTITLRELPPAEWFTEPLDVPMAGALMINEHGRLWGCLAPLGTGHRAHARNGVRLEAPIGDVDYSRFNGAWAPTAAGLVPAGAMTMDCGHAPTLRTNHDVAVEHYDNSCSVFGRVAAGPMSNGAGAWVAGAIGQGVSPDHVARALACRCSGDWQPHPDRAGWQELIACLLVPVPGFGTAHAETVYEGGALVASAVPVRYAPTSPRRDASARARATGVVALADASGRRPADRIRALGGH